MPRISSSLDRNVRLYGTFLTEGSLSQVAAGFSIAFPDCYRFPLEESLGNDLDEKQPLIAGASAEHAIFVGPLSKLHQTSLKGNHKKVWTMVTPNSTEVGGSLVEKVERHSTNLLTPSHWTLRIVEERFSLPVTVVPHGVHPDYKPYPAEKPDKFTVLHLSSTLQERKGTKELLWAWKLAGIPDSQLLVSVPNQAVYSFFDLVEELGLNNVHLTQRLNFSPSKMARLYCGVHYVCQPSRGEGFGLVPLEARACGTPVIATACTGHSEHMYGPGIVEVPTRELGPLDDLPGSLAPKLDVEDLSRALLRAYREYETKKYEAANHSTHLREHWSWEKQVKELRNGFGKH